MLAFPEVSINIILLAIIVLASASIGYFINLSRISKQKAAVLKLEAEMLQNHAEILQLQKELSDRDNNHSKTPIFSIRDNAPESLNEQLPGKRIAKKLVGGAGKSGS